MTFTELFNKYYDDLQCSVNQLSKITKISPTIINKIKNGEKISSLTSDELFVISKAFVEMSEKQGIQLNIDVVYKNLYTTASYFEILDAFKNHQFIKNLNVLLNELKIKNIGLARTLKLDPSYISRIRTGQRPLINKDIFVADLEAYLLKNYISDKCIETYSKVFNVLIADFNFAKFTFLLNKYLFEVDMKVEAEIKEFINNLYNFNVREKDFSFNFKGCFTISKQNNYYGMKEAKKAVLDFFIQTFISEHTSDIIIYNNYNSGDDKINEVFLKRWQFLIDNLVEKGHKIFKIHIKNNDDMNFLNEIKIWLPLYLKDYALPFMIEDYNNYLTKTLLYSAEGVCALTGESSLDFQQTKLFRTNKEDVVSYYTKKNQSFLKNAYPIGQSKTLFNKSEYYTTLNTLNFKIGDWLNVLSSPSINVIPSSVINKILNRYNISLEKKQDIIKRIITLQKDSINLLKTNKILDYFPFYSKEEFNKFPVKLATNRIFSSETLYYNYEEYQEHLKAIDIFSKKYSNYSYVLIKKPYFDDLELFIQSNNSIIALGTKQPLKAISFSNDILRGSFDDIRDLINSHILKDENFY